MKISPKYKVRKVADENIVLLQGKNPGDMTTVMALNESALMLWNSLKERDFELADVVNLLQEEYDVDAATAEKDAARWIDTLKQYQIVD